MHRLLVETEQIFSESAVLAHDEARHLKVLRPKAGEEIELFDGKGRARTFRCSGNVTAPLEAASAVREFPAPSRALTLFACVTKGSRWDWTVEKAVELGVTAIVPVISARCVVRLDKKERAAKRERWLRIAEDAARQSDAKWIPEISEAVDFKDSLPLVEKCLCFVGALVDPPPRSLLTAALSELNGETDKSLALYVGPVGDFSQEELSALLKIAVPTSFGASILRAETAAVYGVSVLAAAMSSHAVRANVKLDGGKDAQNEGCE
jgi:16S rRNA (uracil1498-N3)-methyltransferase